MYEREQTPYLDFGVDATEIGAGVDYNTGLTDASAYAVSGPFYFGYQVLTQLLDPVPPLCWILLF